MRKYKCLNLVIETVVLEGWRTSKATNFFKKYHIFSAVLARSSSGVHTENFLHLFLSLFTRRRCWQLSQKCSRNCVQRLFCALRVMHDKCVMKLIVVETLLWCGQAIAKEKKRLAINNAARRWEAEHLSDNQAWDRPIKHQDSLFAANESSPDSTPRLNEKDRWPSYCTMRVMLGLVLMKHQTPKIGWGIKAFSSFGSWCIFASQIFAWRHHSARRIVWVDLCSQTSHLIQDSRHAFSSYFMFST